MLKYKLLTTGERSMIKEKCYRKQNPIAFFCIQICKNKQITQINDC